ncbi:metal ABC transporter permease [Thalassococcus sp. CAU 1522]|uniref:Metal ABC transporter permease n=1 Tax=Thalassococcus arenae TaxID=2851652 RepID=A0ABS6N4R6_9RHOB|nr:metal ABC transporter permease [Thalassococcus arenae]MBV2359000.1 metal ABC transporter permease [Thalassococcus arenae]
MLRDALLLQLGYNATLVALGAAALGLAAGTIGSFLHLRKRALVSDAISHATLPGLALAFIGLVLLGQDGRSLPVLMAGAAVSAWAGLWIIGWLTRSTRMTEDGAIGAILSVFFGFGIVLLTVIQSLPSGRQAGLEGFLLGSTAGMLRADAITIAIGGALVLAAALALRRAFLMVAFDQGYAEVRGLNIARLDLALMTLVLAVTVVGLKVVGLILVVALLIIPPVAARFWTDRAELSVAIAALLGGLSGYLGAAVSATAPDLPTGPIIVLVAFTFFAASMLLAPRRGVVAALLHQVQLGQEVHRRQGLVALAHGLPVHEARTRRLLRRAGLMRADGVVTEHGRAAAANAVRDEARWRALRGSVALAELAAHDNGLTRIDEVLTRDQISEIDRRIGPPKEAT